MERRGLHAVLVLVASFAGAEFAPDLCACLSKEDAGAVLGGELEWSSSLTGYGIGCSDHYLNLTECSCEPLSEWCTAKWCWVDPNACGLTYELSGDFHGLAKSYAACGYVVPLRSSHVNVLDRLLNICPLANTGGSFGTYFDSVDELHGAVPALMHKALGDLHSHEIIGPEKFLKYCENLTIGNFDCCVDLTSFGVCDICLTEATINADRLKKVRFFPTSDENRQIVAKVKKDASNMFFALLRPLTPWVWLMTVLVPLPALLCISCTHFRIALESASTRRCRPLCCQQDVENAEQDWPLCACFGRILCYKRRKHAKCGKISLFGFRMFLEISLLLYGAANLSYHLSKEKRDASVETLVEVRKSKHTVGMQRTDAKAFSKINLQFARDPSDDEPHIVDRSDLLKLMDDGHIDVAITTPQDVEVQHAQARHCDKQLVGSVLQSVPMGIPISPKVADGLIRVLQELRDDGTWADLKGEAQLPSSCEEDEDDPNNALSWEAVVILQAVMCAIMLAGCIIDVCYWFLGLSGSSREPDREGMNVSTPEVATEPRQAADVRLPMAAMDLHDVASAAPAERAIAVVALLRKCKTSPASLVDMVPKKRISL